MFAPRAESLLRMIKLYHVCSNENAIACLHAYFVTLDRVLGSSSGLRTNSSDDWEDRALNYFWGLVFVVTLGRKVRKKEYQLTSRTGPAFADLPRYIAHRLLRLQKLLVLVTQRTTSRTGLKSGRFAQRLPSTFTFREQEDRSCHHRGCNATYRTGQRMS